MLIDVNCLTKSFGTDVLFKDISFKVEPNDRIGLIGANGTGKTTLFNIILGNEEYDGGGIVRQSGIKVGVLQQHACKDSVLSCYDEALTVFSELIKIEKELEEINSLLANDHSENLISRQATLQDYFNQNGGLTFRAMTKSALLGLGFGEGELSLNVSALSGGQRSKLELCKLLLSRPDIMLLDEPTNHLDINSIAWLEEFLKQCKSAFIVISHDRFFLDNVINKVFEIDNRKLTTVNGNYTKFKEVKALRQQSTASNYENTMREVHRIEGIIEQQHRWNREKNIKTAENKQKMIDRMLDGLEVPDEVRKQIQIRFETTKESGNTVLKFQNLSAAFDEKVLFKDFSFEIFKGERIFIVGPNGCGKTTLLKKIYNSQGDVKFGTNVTVGYFDQQQQDLPDGKTIFSYLRDEFPKLTDTEIRNALAVLLFVGDDVFAKLGDLSGGERARVSLCRLMLSKDNFLLLDEPTNHLDLESREILEASLKDFNGTILAVSHDRYFINSIATKIIYFDGTEIKFIDGNYDRFLEKCVLKSEAAVETEKTVKFKSGKEQYLKQKQEQSRLRKLKTALSQCESSIDTAEKQKVELEAELQNPETISDYQKTFELSQKIEDLDNTLLQLLESWEELTAELSEIDIRI